MNIKIYKSIGSLEELYQLSSSLNKIDIIISEIEIKDGNIEDLINEGTTIKIVDIELPSSDVEEKDIESVDIDLEDVDDAPTLVFGEFNQDNKLEIESESESESEAEADEVPAFIRRQN